MYTAKNLSVTHPVITQRNAVQVRNVHSRVHHHVVQMTLTPCLDPMDRLCTYLVLRVKRGSSVTVSYTHLTLPTKLSV